MDAKQALSSLEEQTKKNQKEIDEISQCITAIQSEKILPSSYYLCNNDFDNLKLLLDSDFWPFEYNVATDTLIAENIVELFLPHLHDKQVLDFGCGEGHVVKKALQQTLAKIIGYDQQSYPGWDDNFTTDWQIVKNNGPYDVILLYDVIDHVSNAIRELLNIKSVLKPGGTVYLHCHPWASRHGNHLNIKKAWVHLVFSGSELEKLGIKGQPTTRLIHPLAEYEKWFKTAGFRILRRGELIEKKVEPFFYDTPVVNKRIKRNWMDSYDYNLRQGFHFPPIHLESIEYVLI